MGLFLLDYGAGNVQSLANTLEKLGHSFNWITSPTDFDDAACVIFPGVGAFQTAVDGLTSRGFLEPLRQYIASGRPYFGICIGMQVLFQSSSEASARGLGIIPSKIDLFSNVDKTVPHMGWNSPDAAQWVHSVTQYGQEIFVATVRKDNVFGCQFHPEKSGDAGMRLLDTWLRQPFSSTQNRPTPAPRLPFPPGPKDGLTKRIIACMDVRANDQGDLVVTKGDQYDVREKAPTSTTADLQTGSPTRTSSSLSPDSPPPPTTVTAKVAGAVRNLGKPVALAARYYAAGADELALLNITSFRHSPLRDQPMLAVVRAAAATVFVPLTIGGGIRDTVDPDGTPRSALEVAGAYFRAGADKVSIGSEAVYAVERLRHASGSSGSIIDAENRRGDGGDSAIETIARAYGRQAVVVSIDPKLVYVDLSSYDGPRRDELILGSGEEEGKAWWYQCTVSGGREARDLSVVELARGAEILGAGEILLNSIDRDGTGRGFDIELVNIVRRNVNIPVVASSGAGKKEHFVDVFEKTSVEAALAAGIFHRGEVRIDEVKEALVERGIKARMNRTTS
ncbi:imidazoleglycerol phosphate synthase [Russula aff. rugulosa BPL654]|nr:imidazoleglycerol phosphate synthase [Russula aff. rugulosa BPL654]